MPISTLDCKRATVRLAAMFAAVSTLAGCADFSYRRQGPESAPIIRGPAITSNTTLLEPVYACYRDLLREQTAPGKGPLDISVGEVRDYTGKSSITEGASITQGGTLMVMSALGQLDPAVRMHERFDPRVAELELIYGDKRELGDGRPYAVPGPQGQMQRVPWMPYLGGTIMSSRYYIVGGITELNWNVNSAGIQGLVNQIGPTMRTYTASVGIDLRIVDTKSLVVLHTVTMQKQVTGHEVDANIFNFFGNHLYDISTGTKNDEPIQLAVRATLELGILELIGSVSGVSAEPCMGPAVAAGIVSRGYQANVPPATPVPQPPFVPMPIPSDEVAAARERVASDGQHRPHDAARHVPLPPPAPLLLAPGGSGQESRPDATMRPALPSYLQGPQMLPPPGSLSLSPSPNAAPTVLPQMPDDGAPNPQKQSFPAPAAQPAKADGSAANGPASDTGGGVPTSGQVLGQDTPANTPPVKGQTLGSADPRNQKPQPIELARIDLGQWSGLSIAP